VGSEGREARSHALTASPDGNAIMEKETTMKDEEKEKVRGASEEPPEESTKLDRGKFLKAVGVGIGAVGLGIVTAGQLAAGTTPAPDSGRLAIQKLMRSLVENPEKAREFVENPEVIAAQFGVRLTDDEAKKIKDAFKKLALETGGNFNVEARTGHDEYTDIEGKGKGPGYKFTYSKSLPIQEQPTREPGPTHPTRPPGGGGKRR
jgi:hypothetical protein